MELTYGRLMRPDGLMANIRSANQSLTCFPTSCRNLNGLGLTGELPLGSDVWTPLNTLTTLNLGNNKLQGYLPTAIAALTSLQTLDLSNNDFTGARCCSLNCQR
jgi:Leucine-rich repeat (LRR) protein